MRTLLILIFVLTINICLCQFTENLLIQPLADANKTAFFFEFNIHEDTDFINYNLFPKSLGSIIKENFIEEFHLSFTRGRWKYSQWGLPYFNAASGAELRSYFNQEAIERYGLDQLFKSSSFALSGLFCSSLEFMNAKYNDSGSFIRPFHLYSPEAQIYEGDLIFSSKNSNKNNMRHAILEGEPVCTENLTPWIKMLPNRANSGISKIFSAPWSILRSDYHSIGIHFDKSTKNLKLTLTLVVNERFFNKGDVLDYFEVKSISTSPLSKRSIVHLTKSPHYSFIVPKEYEGVEKDNLISYTLNKNSFNVKLRRIRGFPLKKVDWIKVNRWTVGWGQQYGTLSLLFENNLKKSLDFVYYQSTPWFMKLYFHTMKFYLNGKLLNQEQSKDIIHYILSPSLNREKPTQLEYFIKLNPSEKLLITIDFDKTHLHWTEYNFGPLRGFDIGSGLLSVKLDEELKDYLKSQEVNGYVFGFGNLEDGSKDLQTNTVIYSDTILLTCPVPDFSMPYNVIIMSSTVLGVFFGSMLSILTRKYKDIYKDNTFHSDKFLAVIFRKIKNVIKRK